MQHITSRDSSSFHQDSSIEPLSLFKEKDQPGDSLRTCRESVKLPFEILDKIIKHLHEDRHTLLTASLASKQTLYSCRQILFSTVVFWHVYNTDFDIFLSLLDSPWSSLSCIRKLFICRIPHRKGTRHGILKANRNMDRTLSHLKNVESLWLAKMDWCKTTPPLIIRLVTSLSIKEIQLESLHIPSCDWMLNLLASLPRTIKTISIHNAGIGWFKHSDAANECFLIPNPSLYEQQWYFHHLDSHSMIGMRKMWEPFLVGRRNNKLFVEELYLQLFDLARPDRQKDLPFISDFIKHAGSSIKAISLDIGMNVAPNERDPTPAFESLDFSQCTNIDQVHIQDIEVEIQPQDITSFRVDLIWRLLAPIISTNSPRHIILTVFREEVSGNRFIDGWFPWEETVQQIHERCRGLEKVILRIGAYNIVFSEQYIEELRRTELGKLEQAGILELQKYQWHKEINTLVTNVSLVL